MGFTSSTVDLYSLSTTTYPTIVLRATLTTTDASTTPTLDSYSVLYDYGPIPFPNAPLSVRGTKQIGTDPVVYKYDESDLETDANGFLELSNMEWDTYTIVVPLVSGYDLAYSCAPQPEYLAPGTSQNTSLYLTVASSTDLRIAVTGNLSEFVPGATVAISSPGLSATSTTGSCGQVVFPSVDPGTYNYTVSADGYADESGSVSALADQLVIENVELTPQ
jgi:hypothetical protein